MQGPRTRRRGKIFAHYLSLLVVEHGKATRHDEDPGGRINGRSARSANLETFSPSKWRTPRLVELCSQAVGKAASAPRYTSEVQAGYYYYYCVYSSKQMSSSRDTRCTYTCAASHGLWEDQDSCGTGSCQIPVCKSTIAPLVFIRIDQQNVERSSTSPCSD